MAATRDRPCRLVAGRWRAGGRPREGGLLAADTEGGRRTRGVRRWTPTAPRNPDSRGNETAVGQPETTASRKAPVTQGAQRSTRQETEKNEPQGGRSRQVSSHTKCSWRQHPATGQRCQTGKAAAATQWSRRAREGEGGAVGSSAGGRASQSKGQEPGTRETSESVRRPRTETHTTPRKHKH